MSRSRSWTFTLNNYTSENETTLQSLDTRYIVYGREIAPTTGTLHLQGYIYFDEAKTLSSVKKKIGNIAHLEEARGTAQQNRLYCIKDEDYFEKGIIPDQCDKNGKKKLTATSNDSDCTNISQVKYLLHLKTNSIKPRLDKPHVIWIWGPSGTNKSRKAYENYTEKTHYSKNESKWWDKYYGQDTVIIDDFELNEYWTFRILLKVLDRYPLIIEYKGGTMFFNSKNIIVTSEHHPSDYTPCGNKNDIQQLIRRIDKIIGPENFVIVI